MADPGEYVIMRIPEYYKNRDGSVFAGMMCGAIVSWLFFLFTYGTFQEEQVTLIEKQREHARDLKPNLHLSEGSS